MRARGAAAETNGTDFFFFYSFVGRAGPPGKGGRNWRGNGWRRVADRRGEQIRIIAVHSFTGQKETSLFFKLSAFPLTINSLFCPPDSAAHAWYLQCYIINTFGIATPGGHIFPKTTGSAICLEWTLCGGAVRADTKNILLSSYCAKPTPERGRKERRNFLTPPTRRTRAGNSAH